MRSSVLIAKITHCSFPDPDALYRYGGGSGPIHYSGFQCTGTEMQLAHCQVDRRNSSVTPITNCIHFEDAGVQCTSGK